MRAHTSTYVTDFAARVDEASRNFNFSRSCSRNFCGCGVCQWSEGAVRLNSPVLLIKKQESLRGPKPSQTSNRAQRHVRWARGDFCGGKSHFPEQKSFPCSFCARKSEGFQQKLVRVAVAGELPPRRYACLFSIDHARQISRAKAVIDIDHAHAAGAGIEHRQ